MRKSVRHTNIKRAAKPLKNELVASFERRREHGALKDKKWHDRNFLLQIRANFAKIQNEVLEKYGKTIRVDHRTLDAQQKEAERNGDTFLSKVNLRVAEEYLGLKKVHSAGSFVEVLKKTRAKNLKHLQILSNEDIDKTGRKEYEVREKVKQAEITARNFPSMFTTEVSKLNELKRKFTTTRQNIEKAQGEYLTPSELKTLQTFKESLRQIYHLEQLQKEIPISPDYQVKNLDAYDEIIEAIRQKIATIRKTLKPLEVARIEEKLEKPITYKNIALVAHKHFVATLPNLEEMQHISENIFLNGNLKKLNAEKRKYEKADKKFNSDSKFFSEQKLKLEKAKVEKYAEKFQQTYYLTKTKIELDQRQEKLKKWQTKLDGESRKLEKVSATDDAKQKIAIIAASILRKNLLHVQNFEKEKKQLASIKQNLKLCRERLDFISEKNAKKKCFYRVLESAKLPPISDQNAIISIIADALRGAKYAVQLVARSSGNNLEMEKEWELMSDLDKDELIHKQVFRNL